MIVRARRSSTQWPRAIPNRRPATPLRHHPTHGSLINRQGEAWSLTLCRHAPGVVCHEKHKKPRRDVFLCAIVLFVANDSLAAPAIVTYL